MANTFTERIPILESGDRLQWPEFERRYNAMPSHLKFQLIRGVVHIASPVTSSFHGNPHGILVGWLNNYSAYTPGVELDDNSTLIMDDENAPQPDVVLYITAECGGNVRLTNHYLEGIPELVVEVAGTSATMDLHQKRDMYRDFGVSEYLVWRTFDQEIDWFILRNQEYERLTPDTDGYYKSEVFPGLWLDVSLLLSRDRLKLIELINNGTSTPEHGAFVARLQQNKPSTEPTES